MYTILLRDDNSPITTIKTKIVQNSNLVDKLRFLVHPTYNGEDMAAYTATLEYCTPITKLEDSVTLELGSERYKGYLQYFLPISNELTAEQGDLEIKLVFKSDRKVRNTPEITIFIEPSEDEIIGDISEDTAFLINQKLLNLESEINTTKRELMLTDEDLEERVSELEQDITWKTIE